MGELRILNGDTMRIDMPIDNSMIERACDSINEHGLSKLWIINENEDATFESLNFLKGFSEMSATILVVDLFGNFTDFDNLYLFNNLEELLCMIKNDEIVDLSRFLNLKKLTTVKIESFINLNVSPLKELCFWGVLTNNFTNGKLNPNMLSQLQQLQCLRLLYHVNDFSFEEVNGLDNLEKVIISQCNIKNLNGIEKFPKMRVIDLSYCYSLNDISSITNLPNLVRLELGHCPKIKNLDILRDIPTLRVLSLINFKEVNIDIIKVLNELRCLYLENCKSIPSIKFIDDLKKLLTIIIINTKIVDGDITPALRLKHVGIMGMRHYNIDTDDRNIFPRSEKYSYGYWSHLENILKA